MDRERERRLKELDKAGAMEGAQIAQGEIAKLTQEQQNNLQREKSVLSQQAQERQIISQAAELGVQNAADLSQQNQVTGSAPAMNAQTQQILSKYGINPNQKVAPKSTTVTKSTTKQGATTVENITNTTTTNHNVIRIIQPNIPVSQPNIAMRQGAISNAKFKTWLQKANAQQEELANSQMNDYNRRERSLLRSTDRMMRKLQDLSKTIGRGLDPENMTRTVSGSLKTLLFLFISSIIPIVWKPLMEKLEVFEANFRSFFGMELPGNLKTKAGTVQGWKSALGLEGSDIDEYGVPGAVGKLIKSSFEKLLAKLEHERDDRSKAIARLENEKPENITDINGWIKYIGKLAAAAIGGSEAQATYTEGNRIKEEKTKELEQEKLTINGSTVSMLGEFDKNGELRNEDSAMKLAQLAINETDKDTVDVSKIQASLEKLKSFSKSQNKLIPLAPEFVKKIGNLVSQEELAALVEKYSNNGGYKENQTDYVFKRTESDYDPSEHYSIKDTVEDYGSYAGRSAAMGGAIGGGIVGAVGTAGVGVGAGAVIGGSLGYISGYTLGGLVGLGKGVYDMAIARLNKPGAQMSLVPITSLSDEDKRKQNFYKNYSRAVVSEVSPEFLNELFGIASKNSKKNAFKTENYESISNKFKSKGKKIKVDKRYKEAADDVKTLKLKKAAEDEKDTQHNRVVKKVKAYVSNRKAKRGNAQKAEVKTPEEQKSTAKKIIEYLKEKLGITEEQAAGIAGNLYVESGGFNLQAQGDKGTSYGLAQWHNERKQALFKKTGTSESNPPNLEQQLDYLIYELNNSEKRALKVLKETNTVKDSTLVFAEEFERPAKDSYGYPLHFDRRWGHAEDFYKLLSHNDSNSPVTTPQSATASFTATTKSDNSVSMLAENMTTSSVNVDEISTLRQIVVATGKLVETTALSAQYDAIPRQQNVVNNVTQAAPQQTGGANWKSLT